MKTNRNLTSKDLKIRREAIIYSNGKPIYRAYEHLGYMTNNDLENYLRISQNYEKY